MKFHYFFLLLFAILILSCSDEEIITPDINSKIIDDSVQVIPTNEVLPQITESNDENESSDFLLEKIHFKSTYFEIDEPSSVTFTVNEKPNMGLGRFKENFGASGIFRDTIELCL